MSSPVPSTQFSLPSTAQGTSSASTENFLVSQIVTVVTAAALLLAGWLIFVFYAVGPTLGFQADKKTPDKPPDKAKAVINTKKSAPKDPQAASVNTVDSSRAYAQQEKLVLLRLQQTEFESRTAHLKTIAYAVEQRFQKWDRRVQSLLQSDEGKRLTSSASQFRFLLSLAKKELEQLRVLVTNVREAFAQAPTPLINLEHSDNQLDALENQFRSAEPKFDSLEEAVDELLATSKPLPSGRTLEEAIAALDTEAAESVSKTAVEKKNEQQTRFADEIKTVKEQRATLRTQFDNAQSDYKRIEAESMQQLAEATKKHDEKLRELAQQRLAARKRMEEELPAFRTRLSPFISPGYRQPESRYKFVVVIEAQPISYSALIRIGALDDDLKGLETLLITGDSDSTRLWNDRPFGDFPNYVNWEFDGKNPEIVRQLKAVQEFLRRHGEALMEAKLLAP